MATTEELEKSIRESEEEIQFLKRQAWKEYRLAYRLIRRGQKRQREIDRQMKDTDRRLQETDRIVKDLAKQQEETDRMLKDLAKRQEETDRLQKETQQMQKETQQMQQETERQAQRTDRRLDKLISQHSGLTDSLGRFAEETVRPAIQVLFQARGIKIERTHPRLRVPMEGEMMEVDGVGIGPECTILVEAKLRLKFEDINHFIEKKLPRFFEFFPVLRRPVLYGCVAGMSIDQDIDRYAYKQGLFVLTQSGDNVHILNDEKFTPRAFLNAESQ